MNKDRLGSLFFILAGTYGLTFSIRLPMGKWNDPGPGIFPLTLSILLLTMGVLLFASSKGRKKINWQEGFGQQAKSWLIVFFTTLYIIALGRLGYVGTTSLYLFCLFLFVCRFKLLMALCLSGILSPASWYFFKKILGIQLPSGLLGI